MRVTQAVINTEHLRHNFREVRARATTSLMALVKANAYGHGIAECAQIFSEEGADMLGVAFADEVEKIGIKPTFPPIFVLTPPLPEEAEFFCEYGLHFVAASRGVVKRFSETAVRLGKTLTAHLFIDTGLRREGVEPDEAVRFMQEWRAVPNIRFEGICTHFATADEADKSFQNEQLARFIYAIEQLRQAGFTFRYIHASNSGSIADMPNAHFNLVRPGIALYGYNSSHEIQHPLDLKPVLSLKTRINALRHVPVGESVSYGRRYFTTEDTTIATIPIGYGDGWTRLLTGKSECIIRGKRFPIVGAICMDQCLVNIGREEFPLDEEVTLIGQNGDDAIWADEIAAKLGTIHYEILTSISARVPRICV